MRVGMEELVFERLAKLVVEQVRYDSLEVDAALSQTQPGRVVTCGLDLSQYLTQPGTVQVLHG